MTAPKLTIAIDGYSSCGKSTLARDLARELGYIFIDSGAMYRAITLFALDHKLISDTNINTEGLRNKIEDIQLEFQLNTSGDPEIYMNGENVSKLIRRPLVSNFVSQIAKIDFIREKLVHLQREMAKDGGIVMDGRDIGTVVFPNAELKIFVTASTDIRAQRRYKELKEQGVSITFDEVKQNLIDRDLIDSTREISPLKQAPDAIVLDNSHMTRKQQLALTLDLVNQKSEIFD